MPVLTGAPVRLGGCGGVAAVCVQAVWTCATVAAAVLSVAPQPSRAVTGDLCATMPSTTIRCCTTPHGHMSAGGATTARNDGVDGLSASPPGVARRTAECPQTAGTLDMRVAHVQTSLGALVHGAPRVAASDLRPSLVWAHSVRRPLSWTRRGETRKYETMCGACGWRLRTPCHHSCRLA